MAEETSMKTNEKPASGGELKIIDLRDEFLNFIYPLPHVTRPDARCFNADINDMNEGERLQELEKVRLRVLLDPDPCKRLLDRLDALEAAGGSDHAH